MLPWRGSDSIKMMYTMNRGKIDDEILCTMLQKAETPWRLLLKVDTEGSHTI